MKAGPAVELSIREAAKIAQVAPRTLKKRLLILAHEYPGLLQHYSPGQPRKYFVGLNALKKALHMNDDAETEDVAALQREVRELRKDLRALAARLRAVSRPTQ